MYLVIEKQAGKSSKKPDKGQREMARGTPENDFSSATFAPGRARGTLDNKSRRQQNCTGDEGRRVTRSERRSKAAVGCTWYNYREQSSG
jgi:hypothetical protein